MGLSGANGTINRVRFLARKISTRECHRFLRLAQHRKRKALLPTSSDPFAESEEHFLHVIRDYEEQFSLWVQVKRAGPCEAWSQITQT